MKRQKEVAVYSLRRAIEGFNGPIGEITVDSITHEFESYKHLLYLIDGGTSVVLNRLFNQGDTRAGRSEIVLNGNIAMRSGVACVELNDGDSFSLDSFSTNEYEQVLGVVCSSGGADVEVLASNTSKFILARSKAVVRWGYSTEWELDTHFNTSNPFTFELKNSEDKETISYRRTRDPDDGSFSRPDLYGSTEAESYTRLNKRVVRYSDTFTSSSASTTIRIGENIPVGESLYISELIVASRRMNFATSTAFIEESEREFKLFSASKKSGVAGIVERASNEEFNPVSFWEGTDSLSNGPTEQGAVHRDPWYYQTDANEVPEIVSTPSGEEAVYLRNPITDEGAYIRTNWDNVANPLNYNTNNDDGITCLFFMQNLTAWTVGDPVVNQYLFFKDNFKLSIRENKFRRIVRSVDGETSQSGRFEVEPNAWIGGGIVYSRQDELLKVHTGTNDIVYTENFDYLPDSTDTKAFIGGNSANNDIPDVKVAAFMFLPRALDPDAVSSICAHWQSKFGIDASANELVSGIDPSTTFTDPLQVGYDKLRIIRQDVEDEVELQLSPDGPFNLTNGNEIVSYVCPMTQNVFTINANPPLTLDDDAKTGRKVIIVPPQVDGVPASISTIDNVDAQNKVFVQMTCRDTLDFASKTYFNVEGSSGNSFSVFREENDYNTKLKSLPSESTTSFPKSDSSYTLKNQGVPTRLLDVFSHPIVARSLFRFWSRCTSNYNISGAIGRNRDWEERGIGRFIIENQRWARDCAIAGMNRLPTTSSEVVDESGGFFEDGDGNIRRAIRFINWGWGFQILDSSDENYGGFDSGDLLHSSSFFLEAAANIYQCFTEYSDTSWLTYTEGDDSVADWPSKLRLLAEWLGDRDIWDPSDNPSIYADSLEPFTHRFFLRGWGIWLTGHILDDADIKASGETLIELGISKQTENGTNPERWAFDTSYQCVGCALLGQYYILSDNETIKAKIPDIIEKAMDSAIEEFDLTTGEVVFEGYRATTEVARAGGRKSFDMRFYAYASIFADAVLQTDHYSKIAARVISYDGRYHDLTTMGVNIVGSTGSLIVDGNNESESMNVDDLGSTLSIELGDGVNTLELFDLLVLNADASTNIFGVASAVKISEIFIENVPPGTVLRERFGNGQVIAHIEKVNFVGDFQGPTGNLPISFRLTEREADGDFASSPNNYSGSSLGLDANFTRNISAGSATYTNAPHNADGETTFEFDVEITVSNVEVFTGIVPISIQVDKSAETSALFSLPLTMNVNVVLKEDDPTNTNFDLNITDGEPSAPPLVVVGGNKELNAIAKLPARKYRQPVADEDDSSPLFNIDETLE